MLVGAGGNAGNQSAVNVIRGLAMGRLSRADSVAVLWRETKAGLVEGVLLTSVGFWRVYLFQVRVCERARVRESVCVRGGRWCLC